MPLAYEIEREYAFDQAYSQMENERLVILFRSLNINILIYLFDYYSWTDRRVLKELIHMDSLVNNLYHHDNNIKHSLV